VITENYILVQPGQDLAILNDYFNWTGYGLSFKSSPGDIIILL